AKGGTYRLCWAASGFAQALTSDFEVDIGSIQVLGPGSFHNNRTCISGQLCMWGGVTGFGLEDGDRVIVMDECSKFKGPSEGYDNSEHIVPRFPSEGRSLPAYNSTSDSGSVYSWGGEDSGAYVTAQGGSYRICWASKDFGDLGTGYFRFDAGTLSLVGPAPLVQERTCVSGQVCKWSGLQGHLLSDGDTMMVLDTCGSMAAIVPRWNNPDAPRSLPISQPATDGGITFSWGHVEVSTPGGLYRLCWCAHPQPSMNCSRPSHFRTDAGTLHVVGPWPSFQSRTCVAGQPCAFGNITGAYLQGGDKIMVLDTCANHYFTALNAIVPRMIDGGLTESADGSSFALAEARGHSISSAGGLYRLCWCASGFNCQLSRHFQTDAGAISIIGPAPLYQDRTCVSGQPCFAASLTGQDLGNGDRLMVLETCGFFTAPLRFTGGGVSSLAEDNGTLVSWGREPNCLEPYNYDCRGVRPTSKGGNFRLCWCAHNYTCEQASDFRVDMGHLAFLGPYPLTYSRTCVAGQPCAFSGIEGHFTQNGDKMMVLDTCAHPETLQFIQSSDKWAIYNSPLVAAGQYGWFDGPSDNASFNGSSFTWGSGQVISSPGGLYRLCWCAANYQCVGARDFQTDTGQMIVVGPFLELPDPTGLLTLEQRLQIFSCVANEPCSLQGLQGRHLADGDLLMVRRDCSPAWETNSTVEWWPSNTFTWGVADPGIVRYTLEGVTFQDYNWAVVGTTSEREVRSEGAYYRLCWCAKNFDCTEPKHFAVDAGTMKLIGPHHNQGITCFSGAVCIGTHITGVGLSNGDRTMVLRYCNTDLYISRFPNDGYSDPAVDNGTTITWAGADTAPLTAPGGFYKLCWCAASQTCTRSGSNFRVEYGQLYIVGPAPLTQSKTCLSGEYCNVTDYSGYGLNDGDRLMISSQCGDASGVVPRFPKMGISEDAIDNGTSFYWNSYVTAGGGVYWMCWCSNMYSCDRSDQFNVESGLLTLPGPYLNQERTCRSGTECGFGGLVGVGLADGDRIMIMNQCGDPSAVLFGWPDNGISDPAFFTGTEYAWGTASGGLYVTGAGGEYSMCWCSVSAPNCSTGAFFRTELGIMKMVGPAIGQRKACTAGQLCSISQFGGYELQNGDRILISPSC
ncbi:unnamed protein product, partial [Effrenium voratum]